MLCNDGTNIVNNPRSVHVGCAVDKVAVGEVILRMIHFSPCQYYSTSCPYLFFRHLSSTLTRVKQSQYRPGQALRVLEGWGAQNF